MSKDIAQFEDMADDCHFVTLTEIVDEYDGQLASYMAAIEARNIVVTMQVDMAVGKAKAKPHAAAVAVTYDVKDPEDIAAQAKQFFPASIPFAFGWVPANLYGTDDFGIFVEQGTMGEKLANGMIDDMIQSAHIEAAVTA